MMTVKPLAIAVPVAGLGAGALAATAFDEKLPQEKKARNAAAIGVGLAAGVVVAGAAVTARAYIGKGRIANELGVLQRSANHVQRTAHGPKGPFDTSTFYTPEFGHPHQLEAWATNATALHRARGAETAFGNASRGWDLPSDFVDLIVLADKVPDQGAAAFRAGFAAMKSRAEAASIRPTGAPPGDTVAVKDGMPRVTSVQRQWAQKQEQRQQATGAALAYEQAGDVFERHARRADHARSMRPLLAIAGGGAGAGVASNVS